MGEGAAVEEPPRQELEAAEVIAAVVAAAAVAVVAVVAADRVRAEAEEAPGLVCAVTLGLC